MKVGVLRIEDLGDRGKRLVGVATADVASGDWLTLRKRGDGRYDLIADGPRKINTDPETLASFLTPEQLGE